MSKVNVVKKVKTFYPFLYICPVLLHNAIMESCRISNLLHKLPITNVMRHAILKSRVKVIKHNGTKCAIIIECLAVQSLNLMTVYSTGSTTFWNLHVYTFERSVPRR